MEEDKRVKNDVKERRRPFSEIPFALLCEILGRVPVKTCFTCELVCKEWHRAVKSHELSSVRHERATSRFSVSLYDNLCADAGYNLRFVEHEKALHLSDTGYCFVGVDDMMGFRRKVDPSSGIWTLRAHRGEFVCFASRRVDFFVCHLITGQYVKLQNMDRLKNLTHIPFCELGRCPVSGQLKALVLVWYEAGMLQEANVQTLGDGEWRSVGNAPLNIWRRGCFLNGSSHWLDHQRIWSFDFVEEKFSHVSLPRVFFLGPYEKQHKTLSTFKSCLCLTFSSVHSEQIDVWIMKEYGVRESWVKQFVIVHKNPWIVPMMRVHNGKILLRGRDEIYLYDPQTKVSKTLKLGSRWAS